METDSSVMEDQSSVCVTCCYNLVELCPAEIYRGNSTYGTGLGGPYTFATGHVALHCCM